VGLVMLTFASKRMVEGVVSRIRRSPISGENPVMLPSERAKFIQSACFLYVMLHYKTRNRRLTLYKHLALGRYIPHNKLSQSGLCLNVDVRFDSQNQILPTEHQRFNQVCKDIVVGDI